MNFANTAWLGFFIVLALTAGPAALGYAIQRWILEEPIDGPVECWRHGWIGIFIVAFVASVAYGLVGVFYAVGRFAIAIAEYDGAH